MEYVTLLNEGMQTVFSYRDPYDEVYEEEYPAIRLQLKNYGECMVSSLSILSVFLFEGTEEQLSGGADASQVVCYKGRRKADLMLKPGKTKEIYITIPDEYDADVEDFLPQGKCLFSLGLQMQDIKETSFSQDGLTVELQWGEVISNSYGYLCEE